MKKIHAKSPCCDSDTYRFGERRRQCKICKHTWRTRIKRKGRKKKRVSKSLVIQYLSHAVGSAYARSTSKQVSARAMTRDIVRSRDLFCRTTPWPESPKTEILIAIADAVIKRVARKQYTAYCILLRGSEQTEATILEPTILAGGETQEGWRQAFDVLPESVRSSTKAIVCDGHRGMVNYAKNQKWLIQRCQFHLIKAIQGRRSRFAQSRHQKEAKRIFDLVYKVLDQEDEKGILRILFKIEACALSTTSKELRRVLLGFVNNYEDYRTYLYHPELCLPTTSNTAESFIGCVEELCHRLRGFPNVRSFSKWIEALAKFKKKVKCNGHFQPRK